MTNFSEILNKAMQRFHMNLGGTAMSFQQKAKKPFVTDANSINETQRSAKFKSEQATRETTPNMWNPEITRRLTDIFETWRQNRNKK